MTLASNVRGLFVVLEGCEGSGKTGAVSRLADYLQGIGRPFVATREPGGTPEGTALRSLLLADDGYAWDPRAELLLMTAARIQHVTHLIDPAVSRGQVVICDRFVGSTLAYQGAGRGLSEDLILRLHNDLVDNYQPDLTIVLDVDPRTGVERSQRRLASSGSNEGRFEQLDFAFHDRVRQSFLRQARDNPGKSVVIDATRPLQQVQSDVVRVVGVALGVMA